MALGLLVKNFPLDAGKELNLKKVQDIDRITVVSRGLGRV